MIEKQRDSLISVLLDPNADYGARDDAAMELANFPDKISEGALLVIACDFSSDEGLSDSCGESLGEIWSRRDDIPFDILEKMNTVSLRIALATLDALNPSLRLRASKRL